MPFRGAHVLIVTSAQIARSAIGGGNGMDRCSSDVCSTRVLRVGVPMSEPTRSFELIDRAIKKVQEMGQVDPVVVVIHPEQWKKIPESERAKLNAAGIDIEVPATASLEMLAAAAELDPHSNEFWNPDNVYIVPVSRLRQGGWR
jgi:hypothetical protein